MEVAMSDNPLTLPHSLEDELGLLCSIFLTNGTLLDDPTFTIVENDFHIPAHRDLFYAFTGMHNASIDLDIITVTTRLRDSRQLDSMGGSAFLSRVFEIVPTDSNWRHYAANVRGKAWLREKTLLGDKVARGTATPDDELRLTELLTNYERDEFNERRIEEPGLNSLISSNSLFVGEPILPDAALYGIAGAIIRKIEPHTETHPAALLIQLLVGLGNLIGRSPYFTTERDKQHGNLFTVVVGASSRGRKGTSWGQVRHILESVDPDWEKSRIMGGLASGEGVIAELQDAEPGTDSNSVTDKRLLVFEGEFAQVLRVLQRDGNTLSGLLRNGWDTGNLRNMSKGAPLRASDCHISMIGHITRTELERLLTANDAANGFANRILWVHSSRTKLLPEGGELHTISFQDEIEHLRNAVVLARQKGKIERSPGAKTYWKEIYPMLTQEVPGRWGEVTSRGEAQVTRLSLLFALLDESETVDKEHLQAACAVWEYCSQSARWAFEEMRFSPDAQTIINGLKKSGSLSLTEINSNLFRGNRKADKIKKALEEIAPFIVTEAQPTNGRSVKVISLRTTRKETIQ
jgi:hypothetical protein